MTLQTPSSSTTATTITTTEKEIENGLDFILSHFEQPVIFPRTIMATELIDQKKYHRFKIIYSREEALSHFQRYNFVDCRINAFPSLKEGATWQPNLIFIDLDLADFNSTKNSTKSLQLTLNKTRKNIEEKLNGFPTILGSGNGYHIIQPVECPIVLEQIKQFQKYNKPSQEFLRFAKDYLSNGKADPSNHPSFNSCLLRIPGSINSKCLVDNRDKRLSGDFRVKVLQRWDGITPLITKQLLYDFHTYLNQKKSDERRSHISSNNNKYFNNNSCNYIPWIEKLLLETPIEEWRKLVIDLVLAPYLINIKKVSYEESYQIIKDWLDKCNDLKRLDNYRNFEYRIKYALNNATNKQIGPMSQEKIKTDTNYNELYRILQKRKIL